MKHPGLSPKLFIHNRSKLSELLQKGEVAVLSSGKLMPRNGNQYFTYRQSSDFYYLTGIVQQGSFLLIFPGHPLPEFREILFLAEPTEKSLKYEGPGLSRKKAGELSGIKIIHWISTFDSIIESLISEAATIYLNSVANSELQIGFAAPDQRLRDSLFSKYPYMEERRLDPFLQRLRVQMEPEEIDIIRQACGITKSAFLSVLQELKPGMREYEIEALISWVFLKNGAEGHAYAPIIASGRNALILHYEANHGICSEQDLLLLDIGADLGYYASDLSRTIPVNGKFNKRQKELYNANVRVLKQAISLMTVGKKLADFNEEVGLLWEKEHVQLGLYSMSEIRSQGSWDPLWRQYYWHGTSHSIGLDVHDPFDQDIPFQPGMILSCEPGIYLREEGIGIRLENDILITAEGPVDLTRDVPLEADEIEELMLGQS